MKAPRIENLSQATDRMLQVGDMMDGIGKENEGEISELRSGFLRWWQMLHIGNVQGARMVLENGR